MGCALEFDNNKIGQVYEIRLFLEKIAIRVACQGGKHAEAAREFGQVIDWEHHLARGDLLGVMKSDMDFHHEICLGSENEIVII